MNFLASLESAVKEGENPVVDQTGHEAGHETRHESGEKSREKSRENTIVENIVENLATMRGKIVRYIWNNPNATADSIAKEVGIAPRNVQVHLKNLQEQGIIRRIGSDKGGHWEIIAE